MKKKLLSILLCLVMCLSLVPTVAFAVDKVSFPLSESGYYDASGKLLSETPSDHYVHYDAATKTITMKNVAISDSHSGNISVFNLYERGTKVKVALIGSNSITISEGYHSVGMYTATLEITSAEAASLNITVKGSAGVYSHAIECTDLTVSGKAKVSCSADFAAGNGLVYGIRVSNGTINMEDEAQLEIIGAKGATADGGWNSAKLNVADSASYQPSIKMGDSKAAATEKTYTANMLMDTKYFSVAPKTSTPEPNPTPVAIHEVTVLDFESPIAGKTAGELSNLRVPDGVHYTLDPDLRDNNRSHWMEYNEGALEDDDTFAAGVFYMEGAWLVADEGYYFANDCTFTALDQSGSPKQTRSGDTGVHVESNIYAYMWTAYERPDTPPTTYNVWVSGTQITSENKSDVLGDGKVSYDPTSKTLTVLAGADITGTKCNALIYSEESELIINAPDGLTLNSNSAGYGVMMGISGAKVTVNGSTDITVKGTGISAASDVTLGTKDSDTHKFTTGETAVSNGGKITINGSLTAVSANGTGLSAGGNVIVTKDATISSKSSAISNGGSVTIGGNADLTSEKGNGISAPGKITLGSDDTATHKIKAYDAAIGSGSDITINGSLTAESVDGAGLSTGGNIKITKNAMISSKDSAINNGGSVTIGGNADLTSEKDCGISAPGKIILGSDDKATHKIKAYDIAITNGSDIIVNGSLTAESADSVGLSTGGNIEITKDATVTSKDTAISNYGNVIIGGNATVKVEDGDGISANGTVTMVSGTWDIDASGTAIKAGEGITYPTDTHTITTPEGGKIDVVTLNGDEVYAVTDANGTIAKHAIIKVQNAVTPDDPANPDNPVNPDNPANPDNPTTPTTPTDVVVPETGDSSNAMLWTMLAVFSGVALCGVVVLSKKRKHN